MPRRIKRPKIKDDNGNDKFKYLSEGENAIFNTMKDAFMLSASIGFEMDEMGEWNKSYGQIPWSVFEEKDKDIINIIALAHTEDINIVSEQNFDSKIEIIEEFAVAGFRILYNEIIEKPGEPSENLEDFIEVSRGEDKELLDKAKKSLSDYSEDLFD